MDANTFNNLPVGTKITVKYMPGTEYEKTADGWIISKSDYPAMVGLSAELGSVNDYGDDYLLSHVVIVSPPQETEKGMIQLSLTTEEFFIVTYSLMMARQAVDGPRLKQDITTLERKIHEQFMTQ